MEQMNHECHMEGILIKGKVRYKDSCPVKGAVVLLEKLVPCSEEGRGLIWSMHSPTDKENSAFLSQIG